jgi:hypothetical protein
MADDKDDAATQLTKDLADKGKLIAGGFAALVMIRFRHCTVAELRNLQIAYMAGAEHLYSSMMNIMDADAEPTDVDMQRMELIHDELMAWRKTQGAAIP